MTGPAKAQTDTEEALAALEAALDAFGPPPALTAQTLDEIDLGAPAPVAPASRTDGIDDALDPPVEALRASLGAL